MQVLLHDGWVASLSVYLAMYIILQCKQEARSCVSLLEEEGMTGRVEENDDCENRKLEGLKRPERVVDIS